MRNRAEIKAEARQLIHTARISPLLMTAAFMAIGFVLDRLTDLVENGSLFFSWEYRWTYLQAVASQDFSDLEAMLLSIPEMVSPVFFFSVLISLVTLILQAGYIVYCMGIRQGLEMPFSTLAEGLSVAGKLIWCWLQVTVKTFLWSLLFIIPGIVAGYRYRFAYYNLLTDPSLSAGGAIRLSCQQTMGRKADLFILDLSFIGWSILSSFTLGLLNVWLTPYITLCDLAYFEEAQIRLGRSPYGGSERPPTNNLPWEL